MTALPLSDTTFTPAPGLPCSAWNHADPASSLRELARRHAALPLPGQGRTLERWRTFIDIARADVTAVKLFEAHADAIAILSELDPAGRLQRLAAAQAHGEPVWAVWAAQPPDARLCGQHADAGAAAEHRPPHEHDVLLSGRKAWCSGAAWVTHALVTYFDEQDQAALAAVYMQAPGVHVTQEGWQAVGMAATASVDVCFDHVPAVAVGPAGAYIARPGFWHGAAGIAACWYGAVLPFAQALAGSMARRPEPHALAHLGQADVCLRQTAALMRQTADAIDADPCADARAAAGRLRASAEMTVLQVLEGAGKALGAGPLCRDADLARRYADLPVFLRQSHARRDLAELGQWAASRAQVDDAWTV